MIVSPSAANPDIGEMKVLSMPKQDESKRETHFIATFKDNGEPLFEFQAKTTYEKLALIQSVKMKMDLEYEEILKSMRGKCNPYEAVA
jgi:hypothetical protein